MLPVFMILRCKIYFMRAGRAKHCVLEKINFIDRLKGTPLACLSRPSGTPRTHCVRNFLPYFGLAKTGGTGLPQQAA